MEEKLYLGIDWGEVRIGLATGDNVVKTAVPFGAASNLEDISKAIKSERIDEIVIGVPYKMRDHEEAVNPLFLKFLEELKEFIDIPVITIDERLSSKGADALIGCKKTKSCRDSLAAMLILQTYLDKPSV